MCSADVETLCSGSKRKSPELPCFDHTAIGCDATALGYCVPSAAMVFAQWFDCSRNVPTLVRSTLVGAFVVNSTK